MSPIIRALAHVALLAVAVSAAGQKPPRAARPDPLDVRAPVPVAVHEPALARYRRFSDEPPIAWREANNTADAIGGWRAYAREAQGATSAPARPAAGKATP
jgi:hypothetical protein